MVLNINDKHFIIGWQILMLSDFKKETHSVYINAVILFDFYIGTKEAFLKN